MYTKPVLQVYTSFDSSNEHKPILTVHMYVKPVLIAQMYAKPVFTVQIYAKPVITIQMYTKPGFTEQVYITSIDHKNVHNTSFIMLQ